MAEITLTAETGRPTGTAVQRAACAPRARSPASSTASAATPSPSPSTGATLRAALTTDAGLNALIDLEVDGDTQLTIVKELQRHPVRRDVLHVDFLRGRRDERSPSTCRSS